MSMAADGLGTEHHDVVFQGSDRKREGSGNDLDITVRTHGIDTPSDRLPFRYDTEYFRAECYWTFLNLRVPASHPTCRWTHTVHAPVGLIGNHAMHSIESQMSQKSAKYILAGQEQGRTSSASERRRICTAKPAGIT
jgi:hypothetical protein